MPVERRDDRVALHSERSDVFDRAEPSQGTEGRIAIDEQRADALQPVQPRERRELGIRADRDRIPDFSELLEAPQIVERGGMNDGQRAPHAT